MHGMSSFFKQGFRKVLFIPDGSGRVNSLSFPTTAYVRENRFFCPPRGGIVYNKDFTGGHASFAAK
jgi:hypothetical protein